jgi:hypothetical protein
VDLLLEEITGRTGLRIDDAAGLGWGWRCRPTWRAVAAGTPGSMAGRELGKRTGLAAP